MKRLVQGAIPSVWKKKMKKIGSSGDRQMASFCSSLFLYTFLSLLHFYISLLHYVLREDPMTFWYARIQFFVTRIISAFMFMC